MTGQPSVVVGAILPHMVGADASVSGSVGSWFYAWWAGAAAAAGGAWQARKSNNGRGPRRRRRATRSGAAARHLMEISTPARSMRPVREVVDPAGNALDVGAGSSGESEPCMLHVAENEDDSPREATFDDIFDPSAVERGLASVGDESTRSPPSAPGSDCPSDTEANFFWPATPEYTPPGSPRGQLWQLPLVAWAPESQQMTSSNSNHFSESGWFQPQIWVAQQPFQSYPSHEKAFVLPGAAQTDIHMEQTVSMGVAPNTSLDHTAVWQELPEQQAGEPQKASPQQDLSAASGGVAWWTAAAADQIIIELSDKESSQHDANLQWICRDAWIMASRRHGCRIVQKALEVADISARLEVAAALEGHVMEALKSPHANHVLQKCIVLLPPDRLQFVPQELAGHAAEAARHRFGCRILERLIEHFPSSLTSALIQEVLGSVSDLCRHQFGNYVVQHILEHGLPEHRQMVAESLRPEVGRLAKHRVASHVVERALIYCHADDKQRLVQTMSGDSKELATLSRSLYGSFVARSMTRAEPLTV
eukprot:CAMPEP_0170601766 /NCGR_PEP_ID=MMETSP0224-20130122/18033_1 /TAXON_ID=285029 /ORGANISM="Togula jolla, Strain CCCM 725" /LENGTH=535 /DNA_ID=CAMNT_0010926561 /DNA_START=233 /DNA_END=1840 /DNA_ORIENTATION=-